MVSVAELLDRAKAGAGLPSDYALARRLGVGLSRVSNWRRGANAPDDAAVAGLCALSGDDAGIVAAELHAQRATDASVSRLWLAVAQRLRGAAPAALAAVVALPVLLVASPDAASQPVIVMSNGMAVALSLAIASAASWLVRARRALT